MNLHNYTNAELILMTDNLPNPTPLEKELSNRLEQLSRDHAVALDDTKKEKQHG